MAGRPILQFRTPASPFPVPVPVQKACSPPARPPAPPHNSAAARSTPRAFQLRPAMQSAACSTRSWLAGSPAPAPAGGSSGSGRAPRRAAAATRRLPLRVAAAAEVQQPSSSSAKEVLERAADRTGADGAAFDPRAFRRSLNSTGRYTRKPSNDPDSLSLMEEHGVGYSTAGLVAQMREQGYAWRQGDVNVKLAEAYGFCWGVERAVQMAYEARRAYPGQRLHITNEIIHNPSAWWRWWRGGGGGGGCWCWLTSGGCCRRPRSAPAPAPAAPDPRACCARCRPAWPAGVNQRLKEMDVQFIDEGADGGKDFSGVKEGEVVILPAFGASVQEMRLLNDRNVQIVDTTCPWVR